jgi:hypothetical protein
VPQPVVVPMSVGTQAEKHCCVSDTYDGGSHSALVMPAQVSSDQQKPPAPAVGQQKSESAPWALV